MADTPHRPRAVICVLGPHAGCGKTLFITRLIPRLTPAVCLKVSAGDARPPPDSGSGHAAAPSHPVERAEGAGQRMTDTDRYLAAGAAQAEWLCCPHAELAARLCAALARVPGGAALILESSRAASLLNPDAVFLIVRPPWREMKASTFAVLPLVTDLLINNPSGDERASLCAVMLERSFPKLRPRHLWIMDLGAEELSADLLARLDDLRGGP